MDFLSPFNCNIWNSLVLLSGFLISIQPQYMKFFSIIIWFLISIQPQYMKFFSIIIWVSYLHSTTYEILRYYYLGFLSPFNHNIWNSLILISRFLISIQPQYVKFFSIIIWVSYLHSTTIYEILYYHYLDFLSPSNHNIWNSLILLSGFLIPFNHNIWNSLVLLSGLLIYIQPQYMKFFTIIIWVSYLHSTTIYEIL